MEVHLLSLRFTSTSLEDSYIAARGHDAFAAYDWSNIYLNLASHAWLVLREFSRSLQDGGSKAGAWASLLCFCIVFAQYTVMRTQVWKQRRTPLVIAFRAVRLLAFSNGASMWVPPSSGGGAVPLFKSIVLQSGSLVQIWLGLGMPLPFLEHVLVQSASVLYMALGPGRQMCSTFEDDAALRTLWDVVRDILLVLGGAPLNNQSPPEFSPVSACSQLVMLSHLWLGHVVPTLILSRMELSSRQNFVEELYGRSSPVASNFPNTFQVLVFCAVGTSCLWGVWAALAGLVF